MTGKSFNSIDLRNLKPFYHVPDARLSEGITYVKETETLVWVDIYKGLIHKVEDLQNPQGSYDAITISPSTYNEAAVLQHPEPGCKESVGVVFPQVGSGASEVTEVLFASKFGIGRTNFRDKKWEYLVLYSYCPLITQERARRLRSNDGNVSPCGKYLFVGLMNDFPYDVTDEGCIVRVSLKHPREVQLLWENIKIPNAIHWDPSGDYTYVTDSLDFTVWKIDNRTKAKTRLIDVKKYNPGYESPEPDGSALNPLTNTLFVAIWSTGKVQEYSLDSGLLLNEFVLPAASPRVSCCVIVGTDLYVTTASAKMPNGPDTTVDTVGGSIYKVPNAVRLALDQSSKKQLLWED